MELETVDIQLSYLIKGEPSGTYCWPRRSDTSWQSLDDVISMVGPPDMSPVRGILINFDDVGKTKL